MLYEFRGVDLADKETWPDYLEVYTLREDTPFAEGMDDFSLVMPTFVHNAPTQAKEFIEHLSDHPDALAKKLGCYLSPGLIGLDSDMAARVMSNSLRDPDVRPLVMDFMGALVESEDENSVLGRLDLRQLATVVRAYKVARAGEVDAASRAQQAV
ncbi:MAG TPA: hypothetical protein VFI74_04675 [Candidatus Saccharimonadales bacterium]|nr:hypothetical protein [Candidatus Saccharimonadales bacterium]